ncbi:MAG: shikimate kinase [Frankiaceae bacterium]|nr:shikimate kinase [Frankiaceae bacterium]
MTVPVLVLVGPPGAGKSTVGRLLAARLGVAFRDTDDDVEAAAGKTVPEIFFAEGEAAFRALEHDAVDRALREHAGVLSLGGGAVLDERTRARLKPHNVAFLTVGLADATKRIGLSAPRPVLQLNPRAQLQQLLAERLPLYREVASIEISTDGKTPEQVLEELLLSE